MIRMLMMLVLVTLTRDQVSKDGRLLIITYYRSYSPNNRRILLLPNSRIPLHSHILLCTGRLCFPLQC